MGGDHDLVARDVEAVLVGIKLGKEGACFGTVNVTEQNLKAVQIGLVGINDCVKVGYTESAYLCQMSDKGLEKIGGVITRVTGIAVVLDVIAIADVHMLRIGVHVGIQYVSEGGTVHRQQRDVGKMLRGGEGAERQRGDLRGKIGVDEILQCHQRQRVIRADDHDLISLNGDGKAVACDRFVRTLAFFTGGKADQYLLRGGGRIGSYGKRVPRGGLDRTGQRREAVCKISVCIFAGGIGDDVPRKAEGSRLGQRNDAVRQRGRAGLHWGAAGDAAKGALAVCGGSRYGDDRPGGACGVRGCGSLLNVYDRITVDAALVTRALGGAGRQQIRDPFTGHVLGKGKELALTGAARGANVAALALLRAAGGGKHLPIVKGVLLLRDQLNGDDLRAEDAALMAATACLARGVDVRDPVRGGVRDERTRFLFHVFAHCAGVLALTDRAAGGVLQNAPVVKGVAKLVDRDDVNDLIAHGTGVILAALAGTGGLVLNCPLADLVPIGRDHFLCDKHLVADRAARSLGKTLRGAGRLYGLFRDRRVSLRTRIHRGGGGCVTRDKKQREAHHSQKKNNKVKLFHNTSLKI